MEGIMTEREAEILKIISNNPFISHNEIADQLGITRSSVSVFITNMLKKGIIEGRGYIIRNKKYPLIIGDAMVDIISTPTNNPRFFDDLSFERSADSQVSWSYGGNAKNVAEYLVRFDYLPRIIFSVGSDMFGMDYIRECKEHGINTDSALMLEDVQTAIFIEIREGNYSRVFTTLRSSNIDERISPYFLKTKHSVINNANQILLQNTISRESIEYITSTFRNTPTFYFATAYDHCEYHKGLFDRFSAVLISHSTSAYFLETTIEGNPNDISDSRILKMVSKLMDAGMNSVYMPFNYDKICYANKNTCIIYTSGFNSEKYSRFRFYRDAFMAGIIYCSNENYSINETLKFVAACRIIASEVTNFVNPKMCLSLVNSYLKKMKDDFKSFNL